MLAESESGIERELDDASFRLVYFLLGSLATFGWFGDATGAVGIYSLT